MSKYLEENGLAHFWDKIKQLVNTAKQSVLNTVWPINKGGTNATTVEGARTNLSVLGAKTLNGYNGITAPSGNDAGWVRTPNSGLLPHTQDSSNGFGSVGSSSWPFKNIYAKSINGKDPNSADAYTITVNTTKNTEKIAAGAVYVHNIQFTPNAGYKPVGIVTLTRSGTGSNSLTLQSFNADGLQAGAKSTLKIAYRNIGSSAVAKNAITFTVQIACVKVN